VTPAQKLVGAFQKVRMASLILIISSFITSLSRLEDTLSLFKAFGIRSFERAIVGAFTGSLTGTIVELFGLVIALVAIYAYLRPGALELSKADQRYSTASKLIDIGYLWGLLLFIIGLPLALIIIGIPLLIVGVILLIIGKVGVIILEFNLYDAEKNALYLVAGILSVIGIVISIASPVAWILMYIALGESIGKYELQPPIQPFTPTVSSHFEA